MRKFMKNYKSSIILVISVIIGTIIGLIFKEKASILSPLGDMFINMLLVVVVPLIFLSITVSISKIKSAKRLGKIMITTIITFIITSLVAVVVGFVSTYKINLVDTERVSDIKSSLVEDVKVEELNILERTAKTLTVSKFSDLLSTDNLMALLVFSIIFGVAINMAGKKGDKAREVLESFNEVIMKVVNIIMYYAPIGFMCCTASLVGTFGSAIAVGYIKTFVIYTIVCLLFYFIMYTIYAFMAGGVDGIKRFWKNAIPASLTSIATCSSAASIPVNSECAKKIGVSDDIAETVIPLGTSFHKDGSIIGSVFKIMFLVCLFGTNISGIGGIMQILFVGLIATLLVSAVPIGGGTISEMMILSMMGYPVAALPILTIIATIIDPPATMLNVTGNTISCMLVGRIVDGKNK